MHFRTYNVSSHLYAGWSKPKCTICLKWTNSFFFNLIHSIVYFRMTSTKHCMVSRGWGRWVLSQRHSTRHCGLLSPLQFSLRELSQQLVCSWRSSGWIWKTRHWTAWSSCCNACQTSGEASAVSQILIFNIHSELRQEQTSWSVSGNKITVNMIICFIWFFTVTFTSKIFCYIGMRAFTP